MIPRWHIFWGAIFSGSLWLLNPQINLIYILIVFLSSFLIDFDHYVVSVLKTKKTSLKHSFKYHDTQRKIEEKEKKKGIRKKGDFHIFHTLEFIALTGLIGYFFTPFYYIFIGMVFHSLLDFLWLIYKDRLYRRNYFLLSWIYKKFKRNFLLSRF